MRNTLAALALLSILAACGGPKLYVFDCGKLTFDDVSAFGLTNEETSVREMFVPCYVIEHAGSRLLWDGGLPPNVAGIAEGVPLQEGVHMFYEQSLLQQFETLGWRAEDIDLVAFSHMHFDHVGSANAFAKSKLLIQEPEFVAAFHEAEKHPVFDAALYSNLANSERLLLNGDHDVFGDGAVRIVSTPGHTPGHQVLLVTLANAGPILLSGDLYHFEATRKLKRVPEFNHSAPDTLASMERVEALLKSTGAVLWIEHNQALANTLKKAPAYYD